MVSKYAVEKTQVYYILIIMLLAVNLQHIDVLWLKIVNIFILSLFTWLYYSLHKAWTTLKYTDEDVEPIQA